MFRVGDRIRRVRDPSGRMPVGTEWVVSEILGLHHCKILNDPQRGSNRRMDCFELVQPEVPPARPGKVFYTVVFKSHNGGDAIVGYDSLEQAEHQKQYRIDQGTFKQMKKITLSNIGA